MINMYLIQVLDAKRKKPKRAKPKTKPKLGT